MAQHDITSHHGYTAAATDTHHLGAAVNAAAKLQQDLERRVRDMSAESCTSLEDLCVALEDGIAEMRITRGKVADAMQSWVSRRR